MTSSPPTSSEQTTEDSTLLQVVTNRRLATAIVIGFTLFSGIVHGYLDGRWTNNHNMNQQGSELANLPDQVGDWKLSQKSELDLKAAQMLRCYGSTIRVYQNQQTGASVTVAIMFGPRGPIAVHTPEVCYSSVGTQQIGERRAEPLDIEGKQHSFWSVRFAIDSEQDPSLEVWYGWSAGDRWEAREQPRFWLTENLYKIQAAGPVTDGVNEPLKNFMTAFLPPVEKAIE